MKNTSDLEDKLREYGRKHILIVDTKKNYHLEKKNIFVNQVEKIP